MVREEEPVDTAVVVDAAAVEVTDTVTAPRACPAGAERATLRTTGRLPATHHPPATRRRLLQYAEMKRPLSKRRPITLGRR